jgi:hypothetical protein
MSKDILWAICAVALTPLVGCAIEASPCAASSCAGCCDLEGVCRVGSSPKACGSAGQICVACGAGDACRSGACVPEEPAGPDAGTSCLGCCPGPTCVEVEAREEGCSPENCPDGCCLGSGASARCQLGTVNMACGSGGSTCSVCSSVQEEQCIAHACVPLGATEIGNACVDDNQCAASISPTVALCAAAFLSDGTATAWVNGYCTAECTADSRVCGAAAECFDFGADSSGTSHAYCLKRCVGPGTGQSSCRPGYNCYSFTELDGGTGGYCYPRCDAPRFECSPGTVCGESGYCCQNDGGSCLN